MKRKVWEGTEIKKHRKPNDDTGFIRRICQNIKSMVESDGITREVNKWD